jgi:hypothetical protein
MATQTSNRYKKLLMEGVINFSSDTFKIALMQKGFAFSRATHEAYADISASELPTLYGYTTGGETISLDSLVQNDTDNFAKASFGNKTWSIIGGNLETDGAIIYDDTVAAPVAKPVVGYIDFGNTILALEDGSFTVTNIAVLNR